MTDDNTPQKRLRQEISKIEIDARARGFAVSNNETIYNTRSTVIVAHAFFVPDKDGKLHHYNLEIRKWQRKYVKDDFALIMNEEFNNEEEISRTLAIKEGSGAAVKKIASISQLLRKSNWSNC